MYPDFLGIGAQKAGTTWLHTNLRMHPQIWLPPIKELHYLDQGRASLAKRLFSKSKRMRKARAYLVERVCALPAGGRLSDVAWAMRYSLAPRDDAWYQSLFPAIPGRITGEICPGYARLRGDAVARVHGLMPKAKIVYLIRNPIERSWSYARQYFKNVGYASLDKVSQQDLRGFLNKDRAGHSDYSGALTAWERHYGNGQMLVAFFDDLATDPRGLLRRILNFLSVDNADDLIPATVQTNPNPGRAPTIPSELWAYLARLHYDQLAELHARFDNAWTLAWLASAEEGLAADASAETDRAVLRQDLLRHPMP
jgi:hypothetical protein